MRTFSSAENRRRVRRWISRTTCSVLAPLPIRLLLPVGPGVSLSSTPYVVHIALRANRSSPTTQPTTGPPSSSPPPSTRRPGRRRHARTGRRHSAWVNATPTHRHRVLPIGREVVPEVLEIYPLAPLHQRQRHLAVEVGVPQVAQEPHVLPVADAGQEGVLPPSEATTGVQRGL